MKIKGDNLLKHAYNWVHGHHDHSPESLYKAASSYLKMAMKVTYDNPLTEDELSTLTSFASYVYLHETNELAFEVEETP